MKKIFVLILILVMAVSFNTIGCKSNENEKNDSSSNNAQSHTEINNNDLEFIFPSENEEVFLYTDFAKSYLLAENGKNVANYSKNGEAGYKGVSVSWRNTAKDTTDYVLECSQNDDFSNAEVFKINKIYNDYTLNNLYKSTKYYLRLTANREGHDPLIIKTTFKTSDLGPRPLRINGIHNVRDIGGYKTASGKTTKQGLIYRGGSLTSTKDYPTISLTAKGQKYMSEVLKIKFDMDLRSNNEGGSITESPIPGAKIEWFNINGYASAFEIGYKERFYKVFKTFSQPDNYPIYMHCTGGADRTGTVAFLLNALLGVDEEDLIHDYEFTTFSVYLDRNSDPNSTYGGMFQAMRDGLNSYKGNTLSEKAESYLLSLGLTATEIYNIKAIMLGEQIKMSVSNQEIYNKNDNLPFKITISDDKKPEKIMIDGQNIKFTYNNKKIEISPSDMPQNLTNGKIDGCCFIDGIEYNFTFINDNSITISGFDFSNGDIILDSTNNKIEGSNIVFYDGTTTVKFRMKEYNPKQDGVGGVYIMFGSYGVRARGGTLRMCYRATDGSYKEVSGRPEFGVDVRGALLEFKFTELNDEVIVLDINANGNQVCSYNFSRVENELVAEQIKPIIIMETQYMNKVVLSEK